LGVLGFKVHEGYKFNYRLEENDVTMDIENLASATNYYIRAVLSKLNVSSIVIELLKPLFNGGYIKLNK
jgi:hypothetical protein